MNNLRKKYLEELVPRINEEYHLKSVMEVPRLLKIKVNSGIGSFRDNREAVDSFEQELGLLLGQKPYPRKARKSIASFKVRQGDVIGYSATLRGESMWAFLEKLIGIAIPRIRDFRGLPISSFDQDGNYSLGIKEHIIFPEVNPNTVKGIRSLQLTMVFSGGNAKLNKVVLGYLGMPFVKEE